MLALLPGSPHTCLRGVLGMRSMGGGVLGMRLDSVPGMRLGGVLRMKSSGVLGMRLDSVPGMRLGGILRMRVDSVLGMWLGSISENEVEKNAAARALIN